MDVKEFSAKTIDDAIALAESHFGVTRAYLSVNVVTAPSKGFLGLGAKDATIRAALLDGATAIKKDAPDIVITTPENLEKEMEEASVAAGKEERSKVSRQEDIGVDCRDLSDEPTMEELGIRFLAPIFKEMGVDATIRVTETDEAISFDISGDDVGILIGRRGETLNALQYLISLAVNRNATTHKRVGLDCEGYRSRRADTLDALALRMAAKVRETGRRVSLEPMTAAERRLVHIALEHESDVRAESFGEEPNRRIVIYPKGR